MLLEKYKNVKDIIANYYKSAATLFINSQGCWRVGNPTGWKYTEIFKDFIQSYHLQLRDIEKLFLKLNIIFSLLKAQNII